ncbi:hypothetical protein HMPREF3150_02859 [Pseudomonas aeruginosa]|nr:hypothetical protein HMPREF3150_02859 [Pseudomonas aeruginosa]
MSAQRSPPLPTAKTPAFQEYFSCPQGMGFSSDRCSPPTTRPVAIGAKPIAPEVISITKIITSGAKPPCQSCNSLRR